MRCRPYNYGEAVVFVAAPSHGAVFLSASPGAIRSRGYNCGEVAGLHKMRPFPWDLYATIGKGRCLFQLFI